MTRIDERIETDLPLAAAFDYIADFANSQEWDPGTASSHRLDDGPIGLGSRFALEVRMGGRIAPMQYRIRDFDRPHRVVLVGSGSGVDAVDDIRFERIGGSTVIDYAADIRLGGLLRFVQPVLGGTFRRIGRQAAAGMDETLDDIAHGRVAVSR